MIEAVEGAEGASGGIGSRNKRGSGRGSHGRIKALLVVIGHEFFF